MNLKEERFIDFVKHLWENHPECFITNPWTEKLDGEEWFFAVFLRTLIWNDPKSEELFRKIGGFNETQKKYYSLTPSEFEKWFNKQQGGILVGGRDQRGAHRKMCHKDDNPKALRIYLEKTEKYQHEFIKGKSFEQLYHEIKSIPSIGKLLTFDILSRLIQTKHNYLNVYPSKAYETGRGPTEGLKAIYGENLSKRKRVELYQELGEKIKAVTDISPRIFWFVLEDILCIYRKDKIKEKSLEMLSGELNPTNFSHLYAEKFCNGVQGCGSNDFNRC